jgi:hypothetical protein
VRNLAVRSLPSFGAFCSSSWIFDHGSRSLYYSWHLHALQTDFILPCRNFNPACIYTMVKQALVEELCPRQAPLMHGRPHRWESDRPLRAAQVTEPWMLHGIRSAPNVRRNAYWMSIATLTKELTFVLGDLGTRRLEGMSRASEHCFHAKIAHPY